MTFLTKKKKNEAIFSDKQNFGLYGEIYILFEMVDAKNSGQTSVRPSFTNILLRDQVRRQVVLNIFLKMPKIYGSPIYLQKQSAYICKVKWPY